MMPRYCASLFS